MVASTPKLERTSLLVPPRRINKPAPPTPVNELLMEIHYADQAAANELYERYVGRVEGVVRRHLNRRFWLRVDPEDVVQDVFLAVFVVLQAEPMHFSSSIAFGCWIGQVARNKAMKRANFESAKKRAMDRELRGRGPLEADTFWSQQLATGERSSLEVLAEREAYEAALESLDTTCRRIVGFLEEGRSQIEIAKRLGVTTRTIRRKLDCIRTAFARMA